MRTGKRVVLMAAAAAALVIGTMNGRQIAATASPDWLTPTPTVAYFSDTEQLPDAQDNLSANPCTKQIITYYNSYATGIDKVETKEACVHTTRSFRIARISTQACSWSGCTNYEFMYLSFPGEAQFYRVTGLLAGSWDGCWQVSPDSDAMYYTCGGGFYTVEDLPGRIALRTNGDERYYEFDASTGYSYLQSDRAATPSSIGASISPNGQWAAVALRDIGIVRIKLADGSMRLFTKDVPQFGYGMDPHYELSITDDGRYIAIGGDNVGAKVYAVDDTCGEVSPKVNESWYDRYTAINACPNQDLVPSIVASSGNPAAGFQSLHYVKFSGDGGQITAFYYPRQGAPGSQAGWLTITAAGYVKPSINYLALGDSFSSGEGDLGKMDGGIPYYRSGTYLASDPTQDMPKEECHLSTRSYPYLLATRMNMGTLATNQYNGDWQSVACSGAKMVDVSSAGEYLGQDKRLQGYDAQNLQATALNEYIPGRTQQIEFVKKHQPKSVTLTMGGNDAQFSKIITSCVSPDPIFTGGEYTSTCSYAKSDDKKVYLGSSILQQKPKLVKLYKELLAASKNTKLYVLGYPQFVSPEAGTLPDPLGSAMKCGANVRLNTAEREMAYQSVKFLNSVIRSAADEAGAVYVDTETALGDHVLCGASDKKAANGIMGLTAQESFHPNAYGHELLAARVSDALEGATLIDYTCQDGVYVTCPGGTVAQVEVPSYFQDALAMVDNIRRASAFEKVVYAGGNFAISLFEYTHPFGANSPTSIWLYSAPHNLGTYTTDGSGKLSTPVTIPSDITPGFHTMTLTGTTPSGEPVTYWDIIEVRSPDPGDYDGDGIPNSLDQCQYIQPAGIDKDMDGIDDGCDPEITEPKIPYRLRLGDPTHTYAGQPEKSNYLYLERSVNATTLTGVSGDADPDGDGWAIVGASSGKGYSTTTPTSIPNTAPYANFTMSNYDPAATTPPTSQIIPSIYLRAGDYGCVEYQPTSLAKVLPGETRTLTLTAQGLTGTANHCRSEPATADADHDGQPDSTQPLYMARNGDTTKGEDPTRTYLFRNFYAAEAQLGVTDYTPTGTPANTPDKATQPIQPWNLLATSRDVGYSPVFNHLTITTDSLGKPWPIITARKHSTTNPSSGICIAYQPDSQANTTNIKLATQPTRQLQLMKWKDIPEGVGCE
jgi:lysophospholipase L1-like esterase